MMERKGSSFAPANVPSPSQGGKMNRITVPGRKNGLTLMSKCLCAHLPMIPKPASYEVLRAKKCVYTWFNMTYKHHASTGSFLKKIGGGEPMPLTMQLQQKFSGVHMELA